MADQQLPDVVLVPDDTEEISQEINTSNGEERQRGAPYKRPRLSDEHSKRASRTQIPVLTDDELSSDSDSDIEPDLPSGLDGAAFSSRMPANKLTQQESEFFYDIAHGSQSAVMEFLFIRNKLLQTWLADPTVELTAEKAQNTVLLPQAGKANLVMRIHGYLQRYGFINYGVINRVNPMHGMMPFKVVVLGGGVSGLMAASQLSYFGLEVIIIEPRERIGGRIHTFRSGPYVADLGAMVITGLGGNPLSVLKRQIDLKMSKIKRRCPLYFTTGEMVKRETDKTVELEFNRLLDSVSHLSHHLQVDQLGGKPLSLGQALELVIELQEKHIREKLRDYLKSIVAMQQDLKEVQGKVIKMESKITNTHKRQERLLESSASDEDRQFVLQSTETELIQLFRMYDELCEQRQDLENKLEEAEDTSLPSVYLSPRDRQILDWHFANLEFANATPLSALSLKHWDQDDEFEFTGAHLACRDGYDELPTQLAKGLDVRFNTAATALHYNTEGVEVHTRSTQTGCSSVFRADAVIVAVPLGVLKSSAISFHPPLPEWKTQAINNLGFGLLNKVVLCFEQRFWDSHVHLFGHVATGTASRGELFMFWHLSHAPVLISLMAGEAAIKFESLPDDVIVAKALSVLRSIFGDQIPEPTESHVTRWRQDEYARGSYSYVAAGSSGNDYDFLAAAVSPARNGPLVPRPRVFFAGEHTVRNYPATVHGALLSGLREAGKVGDMLLGTPYTPRPLSTNAEVALPAAPLAELVQQN